MPFWPFGGKKKPEAAAAAAPAPPPPPEPSLGAADRLDKFERQASLLTRKADKLEKDIEIDKAAAVAAKKTGNDRLALAKLRDMKRKQGDLQQLDGMRGNIDQMIRQLREAEEQREIMALMAEAAKDLTRNKLDVDAAEKVHDDIQDAMQDATDIQQVLARPLARNPGEEDELEAELAGLVADDDLKDIGDLRVPKTSLTDARCVCSSWNCRLRVTNEV
eukprot:TRINITY_DN2104_c0_g1_i2.p2 TRINITY_DN2104_c0_g1~~TRINITY_DN2104_c0_g1_i2.p2  ORF type:complete len:219 (-),score=55.73 TRINITY_DN2104_c0_g1_i2:273-929(-)